MIRRKRLWVPVRTVASLEGFSPESLVSFPQNRAKIGDTTAKKPTVIQKGSVADGTDFSQV